MHSIKLLSGEIIINERSDSGEPKGIIHLLHGGIEQEKENAALEYLSGRGFIALSSKAETQGGEAYLDTVTEAAYTAKFYRQKFHGLKYVLWGMGVGGAAAQGVIARFGRLIDGAVIDGGVNLSPLALDGSRLIWNLSSKLKLGGAKKQPLLNFGGLNSFDGAFYSSCLTGLRALSRGALNKGYDSNIRLLLIGEKKHTQKLADYYNTKCLVETKTAVALDFDSKLDLTAGFAEGLKG